MTHSFNFKPTPHLIFGAGRIMELPGLAAVYGRNLLVITGGSSFTTGPVWPELEAELYRNHFAVSLSGIGNEPSPADIDRVCNQLRGTRCDAVVAIGGGSVLDAGKAISAMLTENGSVRDFLEGVGSKKPSGSKIPFIAVPTTSGTGSEATSNAVISSIGTDGFKKSLRHNNFIPDLALIDPQLTISCPKELTVACGMDTFTQLLEAFLSTNSSPLTDALALDGIRAVIRSLPRALADLTDLEARSELSYASYLSGIVLANAGLGTVHGFASALGGYFQIPHGIACGTLMAEVNRLTLQELRQAPESDISANALAKYATLGRLSGENHASPADQDQSFITYLETLTEEFGLPRLSKFGIGENDIERIVATSANKYNPVQFTDKQLQKIIRQRL